MNYKIYIIEDDLSISLLLKDYITKYGFHVKVAENFENIMEDFNEFNPDVVLLDVNLPKYDGFYWCRKIRQKSKIPIIFISARDSGMDQVMALENGADDYIIKPFYCDVIMAKIKKSYKKSLWRVCTKS